MQWAITSRRALRNAVGWRLVTAGLDLRQPAGDAVRGGDQEMTRTAGRVADFEVRAARIADLRWMALRS